MKFAFAIFIFHALVRNSLFPIQYHRKCDIVGKNSLKMDVPLFVFLIIHFLHEVPHLFDKLNAKTALVHVL